MSLWSSTVFKVAALLGVNPITHSLFLTLQLHVQPRAARAWLGNFRIAQHV
jgi:hypothetical protein